MHTSFPFEIEASWKSVLGSEMNEDYMSALAAFVERERNQKVPVYPQANDVFNAFAKTPFNNVKVVIMGQDPYHGQGQAHGLSFSVPMGIKPPPSLKNIYKELANDVGFQTPDHGCLIPWAEQGVLLLNATLTVRESEPMSHHNQGWERFTDAVLRKLAEREEPVIFVLWGKNAQDKCRFLPQISKKHPILTAPHPSPFSAHQGFLGCKHFSKINELLKEGKKAPINWQL